MASIETVESRSGETASPDFSRVLAQYNIVPDEIEALPGAYVTAAWRVWAPAGDFVLRKHGGLFLSDVHVSQQHSLVSRIAASSQAFVEPVPSRLGRTFVRYGDSYYALFPFMQGNRPGVASLTQIAAIGSALASLHAQTFGQVHSAHGGSALVLSVYSRLLSRVCAPADAQNGDMRDWDEAFSVIGRAVEALDELTMTPHSVLHGDLHADNVLVNGSAISFIDYDFVHISEPAYDVAVGIDSICRDRTGTIDVRAANALLESYGSVRTLSARELSTLWAFCVRRNVFLFLYARARHTMGYANKQCTSYWRYLDTIIKADREIASG